ncbi:MAG: hypothetical protein BJ554DRAFT_7704, partial [Olpidium bornovanus]
LERRTGISPLHHTDKGGEFLSAYCINYLRELGNGQTTGARDAPSPNRISERAYQMLEGRVRSIMADNPALFAAHVGGGAENGRLLLRRSALASWSDPDGAEPAGPSACNPVPPSHLRLRFLRPTSPVPRARAQVRADGIEGTFGGYGSASGIFRLWLPSTTRSSSVASRHGQNPRHHLR